MARLLRLLLPLFCLLAGASGSSLLLTESVDYPGPVAVAMGDIDENGWPDAVIVDHSYSKPSLTWVANSGSAMADIAQLDVSVPKQFRSEGLVLADVDLDGVLDIVTWSVEWLYVIPGNDGGEDFSVGELWLTLAGIDACVVLDAGDGSLPDLIVSSSEGGLEYYDQVSAGELTGRTIVDPRGDFEAALSNLTLADVDSDGDDDLSLVLINDTYSAVAWIDVTDGDFASLVVLEGTRGLGSPCVPVWIDFDLDGDFDLMASTETDTSWWRNRGDQVFDASFVIFEEPASLVVARDVTGDTETNIVVVTAQRTLYVDELGVTNTIVSHGALGTPWALELLDMRLNDDAKQDMLLFFPEQMSVFANYGPTMVPDLAVISSDDVVAEDEAIHALLQVTEQSYFGQVDCNLTTNVPVTSVTEAAQGVLPEGGSGDGTFFYFERLNAATNFSLEVDPVADFSGEIEGTLTCDIAYEACAHAVPSPHQRNVSWSTNVVALTDLPQLVVESWAETAEDEPVLLPVWLAAVTDTDGSERFSLELRVRQGASVFNVTFDDEPMAPHDSEPDTFVRYFDFGVAAVQGDFSFSAAEHFAGLIEVEVAIVARETSNRAPCSAVVLASTYFRPVADLPLLDVPVAYDLAAFVFFEDYSITMDLSDVALVDDSEELSVEISSFTTVHFTEVETELPVDAFVVYGGLTDLNLYPVEVAYLELSTLLNDALRFDIFVAAYSTDSVDLAIGKVSSTNSVSMRLNVLVAPVADNPILLLGTQPYYVREDTYYEYPIRLAAITDYDGSESLSLSVHTVQEPIVQVLYQDIPMITGHDGGHTAPLAAISSGAVACYPREHYSGLLTARFMLSSYEDTWFGANSFADTLTHVTVFILPVADPPLLTVSPLYVELDEDTSFVINIDEVALVDLDGSEYLFVRIQDLLHNVERIEHDGQPLPVSQSLSEYGEWVNTYLVPPAVVADSFGRFEVFPIEDYAGLMLLDVIATANDTTPDDWTLWDAVEVSQRVNATSLPVADPATLVMQDYDVAVLEDTRTTLVVQQLDNEDQDGSEDWVVTLTDVFGTIDELTITHGATLTNATATDSLNRTVYEVATEGVFNITILPRRHYSGPLAVNVTVMTLDDDRRFRCDVPQVNVTNTTYGECVPAKVFPCAYHDSACWNETAVVSSIGANATTTASNATTACNSTVFVWNHDLWQLVNFTDYTLYEGLENEDTCGTTRAATNWSISSFPDFNASIYAAALADNGTLDNFTHPLVDAQLCPVHVYVERNETVADKWCYERARTTVARLVDVWVIPVADAPSVNTTNGTFNFLTTGEINFTALSNDPDLSEFMSVRAWTSHPEVVGIEVPAVGTLFELNAPGNGTEVSVALPMHQVVEQDWSLRVHVTPRWGGIAWFRLEVTVVEDLNSHTAMTWVRSWSEVVALEVIHGRRNDSVAQIVLSEGRDWDLLWVRPTIEPVGLLAVEIKTSRPWIEFYPTTLNYTARDWMELQPLLVRAVDDEIDYESHNLTAYFWANNTEDSRYHGKLLWDLEGVSLENDQAILLVDHELAFVQQGINYTFCAHLNTRPVVINPETHEDAVVYIDFVSDLDILNFEPPLHAFTVDDWHEDHCVLVWIQDDVPYEGRAGTISSVITTVDPAYGKLPAYNFSVVAANVTRDMSLPPKVERIVFTNSLDGLLVTFDRDTDMQMRSTLAPFNCSLLFHNETGDDPNACVWLTNRVVEITLSPSATILPGDIIVVRKGTLRSTYTSELYVVEAHGTVETADDPVRTEALFYAPQVVGSCDDLSVTVVPFGHGGRPAVFHWDVADVTRGGDALDRAALEELLDQSERDLFFARAELDALGLTDATVVFRVNYTNFLQFTTNATLEVDFVPYAAASVLPEGLAYRRVAVGEPLVVGVRAEVPACSGLSPAQRFEWRLEGAVVSTRRVLRMPAHSLTVGRTYVFEATAIPKDNPRLNSSVEIVVRAEPQPLVALVVGGTRTLAGDGHVVLNASLSYDPDDPSSHFSDDDWHFEWACKVERFSTPHCMNSTGNGPLVLPNEPVVVLPFSDMTSVVYHGAHVFTVNATRGRRSTLASVTFETTDRPFFRVQAAAAPPDLVLFTPRADENYTLALAGSYSTSSALASGGVALQWSLESGALALGEEDVEGGEEAIWASPRNGTLRVSVLSRLLSPGITYTFRLTARDPWGQVQSGFSDVVVKVNAGPKQGSFSVSPQEGVALYTEWSFVCSDWMDTELPISYSYSHVVDAADVRYADSEVVRVVEPTELPWATAVLRLASTFGNRTSTVRAEISDSLGAVTRRERTVWVQLPASVPTTAVDVSVVGERLSAEDYAGALQRVGAAATLMSPLLQRVGDNITRFEFNETIANRTFARADAEPWMRCPTVNELECSGLGVCERWPRTCRSNETYCTAVCNCDEGWFGDACYLTGKEWSIKANARLRLTEWTNFTLHNADPTAHYIRQSMQNLALAVGAPDQVPVEAFPPALDAIVEAKALALSELGRGEPGLLDAAKAILDAMAALSAAGVYRSNGTTTTDDSGGRRLLWAEDPLQEGAYVAKHLFDAAHELTHALLYGSLPHQEPVFLPHREVSLYGRRASIRTLLNNVTALPQFQREADNEYPLHWLYMNYSIVEMPHHGGGGGGGGGGGDDDGLAYDDVVELHGLRVHSDPYDAYALNFLANSDLVSVTLRDPATNAELNVSQLHSPVQFQVANRVHIPLDDAPQVYETQCRHEGHNLTFDCEYSLGKMHHLCVNNSLIEFRCPVYATRPTCQWWDDATQTWSKTGCGLVQYTPSESVCQCDHLSTFGSKHETVLLEDYHFLYPIVYEPVYNTPDNTVILVVVVFVYLTYIGLVMCGRGLDALDEQAVIRAGEVDREHEWIQEQAQAEKEKIRAALKAGKRSSVFVPERARRGSLARLVDALNSVRKLRVEPRTISENWYLLQDPFRVFRDSNHVVLGFVFSRQPTFTRPQRMTAFLGGLHFGTLIMGLYLRGAPESGLTVGSPEVLQAAVLGSLCTLVMYYLLAHLFSRCSTRASDVYEADAIARRTAMVKAESANRLDNPETGEPRDLDQAELAVEEAEARFQTEAHRLRSEFMDRQASIPLAEMEDQHRAYLHQVQRARVHVMDARRVYYKLREKGRLQANARRNAIEKRLREGSPDDAGLPPRLQRLQRLRLALELDLETTPVHPVLEGQYAKEVRALHALRSFHLRLVHAYVCLRRFRVNRVFSSKYNVHIFAAVFVFNLCCLAYVIPFGMGINTSVMQAYWRGMIVMAVFAVMLFQPAYILVLDWVLPQAAAWFLKGYTLKQLDLDPEGDARRAAEAAAVAEAEWHRLNPPPMVLENPKEPEEGPKVADQPGVIGHDASGGVYEIADQFINLVTGKEGMAMCPRGCGMTFIGRKQAVRHTAECIRDTECPLKCGAFLTPWGVPTHTAQCTNRFVVCPLQGCDLEIRAEMQEAHVSTCQLRLVECGICGDVVQAGELGEHKRDAHESFLCSLGCGEHVHRTAWSRHKARCPERIMECALLCGNYFRAAEREDHERDECRNRVVMCENKCGRMVRYNGMAGHLKHLCPYRDVACEFCHMVMGACELNDHEELDCEKLVTCGECEARLLPELMVVHIADVHETRKMVPCAKGCGLYVRYPYREAHAEICTGRRRSSLSLLRRQPQQTESAPEVAAAAAHSRTQRASAAALAAAPPAAAAAPAPAGGEEESSSRERTPRSGTGTPRSGTGRKQSRVLPVTDDDDVDIMVDNLNGEPEKACTHYGCGRLVPESRHAQHLESCRFRSVECGAGCGARFPHHLQRLHEAMCDARPASCVHCHTTMQHQFLETHERSNCRVSFCDCGASLASPELREQHKRGECRLRSVRCQLGCGALMELQRREVHERTECPRRALVCACGAPITAREMEEHQSSECPARQMECRNGCHTMVPADHIIQHEEWECTLLLWRCECLQQMRKHVRVEHLQQCKTFLKRWKRTKREIKSIPINEMRRRVERVMNMGHCDKLLATTALLEYGHDAPKAASALRRGDAVVVKEYLLQVAELVGTAAFVPPEKEVGGAAHLQRVFDEVLNPSSASISAPSVSSLPEREAGAPEFL